MATDNPLLGGGNDSFNDWASETTQKELKKVLESKLKHYDAKKIEDLLKKIEANTRTLKSKSTGGTGGASGIDFTKAVKELNLKGGAGGGRPTGGGGGPSVRGSVADLIVEKAIRGTAGGAGGGGGPVGIDNKKIKETKKEEIGAVKKTTGALLNLATVIPKSVYAMLSISTIVGSLGSYIGKSIDGYRELIGVGQDFSGSILEMRKSAADAGMGFDTFLKVMVKNSEIIKSVGTREFIALQKNVRNMGNDFGQFGLTIEGTNEFLAGYLEQSIRLGTREKLDSDKQTIGFKNYMLELTALAKTTGKSREALAELVGATMKDTNIRMAMLGMTKEQKANFEKGMKSISVGMEAFGPEMSGLLKEAIGKKLVFGNIGMSVLGRTLSFLDSGARNALEGMIGDIASGGENAGKSLADLNDRLRSGELDKSLLNAARAGDEGALSLLESKKEMDAWTDEKFKEHQKSLRMSKEEREAAAKKLAFENRGTTVLLDMQTKIGIAFGKIQSVILNALEPALVMMGNGLDDFMKAFDNDGEMFKKQLGDLRESFNNLMKSIFGVIEGTDELDIKGFIGRLIEGVSSFVNFIASPVMPILKTLVNNFEWFIAAWAAIKIGGILASFGVLGTVVGWIGGALATAGGLIVSVLGAVTLPIWGLVAAVVAVGAAIWYFWDDIKAIGVKIWDWITNLFSGSIFDWFSSDKNKDTDTATITSSQNTYQEIPRLKPENIARIAEAVGTTPENIKTGNVSQEDQREMKSMAQSGDETAKKILEQLELLNKGQNNVQTLNAEQLRQMKRKSSSTLIDVNS